MKEVEKMYKLANVKAKEYCDRDSDACMNCCSEWENRQNCWKYKSAMPPFTTEKQLEIIKLIANRKGYPDYEYFGTLFDDHIQFLDFNEALAKLVNSLWQDLTEEEQQQVKGILE